MVTHSIKATWSNGASASSGSVSVTADGEDNRDTTLTALQAAKRVNIAIDYTRLKSLFMLATKPVTVETNGTGGGAVDTIDLAANTPFVWYEGCGLDNPLTAAVTDIRLTNGANASASFEIHVLQDATP